MQTNQGVAWTPKNPKSVTQQQFEPDANIQNILAKYRQTNSPLPAKSGAYYGDFTKAKDFKSALDAVNASKTSFLELPSSVRFKFKNDPQNLLNFLKNNKNREEAISLGLIQADPTKKAVIAATQSNASVDPTNKQNPQKT